MKGKPVTKKPVSITKSEPKIHPINPRNEPEAGKPDGADRVFVHRANGGSHRKTMLNPTLEEFIDVNTPRTFFSLHWDAYCEGTDGIDMDVDLTESEYEEFLRHLGELRGYPKEAAAEKTA